MNFDIESRTNSLRIAAIAIMLTLFAVSVTAMPPNPETLEEHLGTGNDLPYYLQNRPALLDLGVNSPGKMTVSPAKANISGTWRGLAILVSFSDKPASADAADFDTLLFVNRQGTVRHYYNEVSRGQLDIVTLDLPSNLGWIEAPETYAYYCNGENGTGAYPNNSQKLCEDVTALIDPYIDFSQYDNDNDGYVDAVILIHTGKGAEFSHSNDDIWSHKWSIWPPQSKDGVYLFDYNIQPEYWNSPGDITCGVFCHELGHIFGLPDLYDTDYSSRGIGKYSLMSYGSWCGPTGMGDYPAWLDAWCRIELGFESYTNVTVNTDNAVIGAMENGGTVYRLWSSGAIGSEYYLVENRQKTGYDSYIPASGLYIWHIDENSLGTMAPNDDEWYPGHTSGGNYGVALEQADGQYHLEKLINSGDAGDPFPGISSNTLFSPFSTPNSDNYIGDNTYVAVSNISSSSNVMTADFQVSFVSDVEESNDNLLPEKIQLGQNYPNPFNPNTNIYLETPVSGHVHVFIYDILGRKIYELLNEYVPAGEGVILTWDGRDSDGREVSSGIYFYEVVTEHDKEVRKMTLIK